MSIFSWFSELFDEDATSSIIESSLDDYETNPANGLPMVGGMGGVDVAGNPYGFDFSHQDSFSTGSSIDDSFSSSYSFDDFSHEDSFSMSSSIDDSFSSSSSFDDW